MEHDQQILSGSRSACSVAIVLVWMVEALFVISLIALVVANVLGWIRFPNADWSDPVVMLTFSFLFTALALFSFGLSALVVAVLANAIANIDTRNFQLEQLLLNLQQEQSKSYIAPARSQRSVDIDTMRIKPERVT